MMKKFDIAKWAKENEELARKSFEGFKRDHKEFLEELSNDRTE